MNRLKTKRPLSFSEALDRVDASIQKSNYLYKDLLLFQQFSRAEFLR